MDSGHANVGWFGCYGSGNDFDGIVLSWIGGGMKDSLVYSDKTTETYSTAVGFITVQKQEAKMIGADWQKGEDARMEYEVIEDDSGIDWDDPDVIADIFEQTDTKFDKFIEKTASIMFSDLVSYVGIVVAVSLGTLIFWHVIKWLA